jgi:hypothetical protein
MKLLITGICGFVGSSLAKGISISGMGNLMRPGSELNHARRRPLRIIGFDGTGKKTRDLFHARVGRRST